MALTLAVLDATGIGEAQALPLAERDRLLDLVIATGRGQSNGLPQKRLATDRVERAAYWVARCYAHENLFLPAQRH